MCNLSANQWREAGSLHQVEKVPRQACLILLNSYIPAKKDSQSSKSSNVDIDPDLLFHRILSVCSDEEQLSEAFSHDLAHYPPSLFSDDGFLKQETNQLFVDLS